MFHFRLAKLISFDLHSNMVPMITSLACMTAFQTKRSTLRRRYKTRLVVWATWGIWEGSNCKKGWFSRKDHRFTTHGENDRERPKTSQVGSLHRLQMTNGFAI